MPALGYFFQKVLGQSGGSQNILCLLNIPPLLLTSQRSLWTAPVKQENGLLEMGGVPIILKAISDIVEYFQKEPIYQNGGKSVYLKQAPRGIVQSNPKEKYKKWVKFI